MKLTGSQRTVIWNALMGIEPIRKAAYYQTIERADYWRIIAIIVFLWLLMGAALLMLG